MDNTVDSLQTPEIFEFPFPPYDIQHQFMQNLYSVIENKQLGIFESPTGTGKSLSIICGAIKWLKDHNKFIRNRLLKEITDLETYQKELLSDDTNNDWLSSKSKEIEVQHQIYSLKLKQNELVEYDNKIDKIQKLQATTRKNERKKWQQSQSEPLIKLEDADNNKDNNIDEEELLLEELKLNSDDEESDEEKEENKHQPTKIYICSRTHSQLSQFVGEIIKSPYGNNIRVASLASRQNYCINPDVTKLKSMSLINERCLDMQKNKEKQTKDQDGKTVKKSKANKTCRCSYYRQQGIEDLANMALGQVQDIEELVGSGKQLKACPYYASRKTAEDAEVVLIPYNTLLHKATREANGINLKDNIVIIDEAHNLLEALAQMHGAELSVTQIDGTLRQLTHYKMRYKTRFSAVNLLSINQLLFVVNKLKQFLDKKEESCKEIFTIENFVGTVQIDNYNMFKLVKFCKDSRIAQKIRSFAIMYPIEEQPKDVPKKGIKTFLSSIENKKIIKTEQPSQTADKKPNTTPFGNPILALISFLEALTYSYEDGRILLDKTDNKLKFLLLNPSSTFADIISEARSVIVAGGTMKPNTEFRDRLFINAGAAPERIVEFSCDHIIPPENILPVIITKGPTDENLLFNFENRMSMGNNIKSIILECCKKVKGGIVVFFPSYSYENWVWEKMKNLNFGRSVFREPQNSGAVENVLKLYAEAIKKPSSKGALLFSVVGGKLSEGLNFSDDLGRCVVVVGMPYANIKAADLKEKMTYLDKTEGLGAGQKFYEGLCMKSVNQCIGRAVRHRNDFATVLLLDERYNRTTTKNSLPGWIKRSLKVCNYSEAFTFMDKFFEDKKNIKNF